MDNQSTVFPARKTNYPGKCLAFRKIFVSNICHDLIEDCLPIGHIWNGKFDFIALDYGLLMRCIGGDFRQLF